MTETWTSPTGVRYTLVYVGSVPEWYPDFPGQRPPARYEMWDAGRCHLERTVLPLEPWSAYDAISDLLIREGWDPPPPTPEECEECEHGLSARLCAGPGHYPPG